jgi:hypothetical protein
MTERSSDTVKVFDTQVKGSQGILHFDVMTTDEDTALKLARQYLAAGNRGRRPCRDQRVFNRAMRRRAPYGRSCCRIASVGASFLSSAKCRMRKNTPTLMAASATLKAGQ